MMAKTMVIALGRGDLGETLEAQYEAVRRTAVPISRLAREGWKIALTFSNSHWAGVIYTAMKADAGTDPGKPYQRFPLSVASAMSQALIGYDLQNAIRTACLRMGLQITVSTVLTQVSVSPYDASFYRPNKEIGKILTEEEALLEEDLGNQVKKLRDGQFRRVVPSPVPETVVELDAIKALIDHGAIVIAAGGGGIPVLPEGLDLRGSAAIIEKDLTASLLARNLGADVLLLSTSVPHVSVSYRQETQRDISRMSPEQAEALIEAGEFSEGTMRPKVEAAAAFARSGKGRRGIITTLSLAGMALAGEAGTTIQIQEA